MTTVRAFFPKLGHFFLFFFKKDRKDLPPLPLSPLVTRLYDRAASMSGKEAEAVVTILLQKVNCKTLYTHCYCRVLK